MIGLVTGFAFTALITRTLDPNEFGTWSVIGSIMAVVSLVLAPTYWEHRYIARGLEVGKTALFFGTTISFLAMPVYVAFAFLTGITANVPLVILLFGVIMVPTTLFYNSVKAIAFFARPQALSYASLLFEFVKLPVAFFLVRSLRLELQGAILAVFAAQMVQGIFLAFLVRDWFRGKIRIRVIGEWIKASWIPLLMGIGGRISTSDVLLVSALVASTAPAGYLRAAQVFILIIAYSEAFQRVLYPKILAGGSGKDVSITIQNQMMLAIPMAVGSAVLAKPLLTLLNPAYAAAVVVLWVLIPGAVVDGLGRTFEAATLATETVDLNGSLKFSHLRKSKLFKVPMIEIVRGSAFLAAIAVGILATQSTGMAVQIALVWAFAYSLVSVIFAAVKFRMARSALSFRFPVKEIVPTMLAAIVMGLIVQLLANTIVGNERFPVMPVLELVAVGFALYFGTLYVLDRSFRELVKAISLELKGLRSPSHS
jgi:hypothetical protein